MEIKYEERRRTSKDLTDILKRMSNTGIGNTVSRHSIQHVFPGTSTMLHVSESSNTCSVTISQKRALLCLNTWNFSHPCIVTPTAWCSKYIAGSRFVDTFLKQNFTFCHVVS